MPRLELTNMSDPIHARLTKLSTLPGATVDPLGGRGLGPIGDGYEIVGHYVEPPTVGHPFQMTRYRSNGVEALGVFTTSPVTEVGPLVFKTLNSTYELTSLYEEAP